MSNPFAERNFDFYDLNSNDSTFEFSQFFTKRKKGNLTSYRVKTSALQESDILYMNLPHAVKAVRILSQLAVNKGIQIIGEGSISESDKKIVKEFEEALLPTPLEFLQDVARMKLTKGNLLCHLTVATNKKMIFVIIEPERFSVLSSSDNTVIAKYDLQGFVLHNKNKQTILPSDTTILVRSSPGSILGVPPLLSAHLYSKSIMSDIKKNFQIHRAGAFEKSLASILKPEENADGTIRYRVLTDEEMALASEQIRICQEDPEKAIQLLNSELKLVSLPVIKADPEFTTRYEGSYSLHTASVTGISPYMILPPDAVNRSTAQQQYSDMIEGTVQPLNNSLSALVQKMFEMWCVQKKINTNIKLTVHNPKATLNIDTDAGTLVTMEINREITTNELRERTGFEPYSDKQIEERDTYRNLTAKSTKIIAK